MDFTAATSSANQFIGRKVRHGHETAGARSVVEARAAVARAEVEVYMVEYGLDKPDKVEDLMAVAQPAFSALDAARAGLRQALRPLRAMVGQAVAALVSLAAAHAVEDECAAATSRRAAARAALDAATKKLHGLLHVALLAVRNARQALVPAF